MYRIATRRMHVVRKHLLDMDQRALARAIAPVLQSRDGDGIIGIARTRHVG
jgi:hypothetical protein